MPAGVWLQALLFATLATVVVSGLHYVVIWGGKASRAWGERSVR